MVLTSKCNNPSPSMAFEKKVFIFDPKKFNFPPILNLDDEGEGVIERRKWGLHVD